MATKIGTTIKVKAYLNLLTNDEKPIHAFMVFLGSLAVFTSLYFYPLIVSFLMSLLSGYVAYISKPQFGMLLFMVLALPAFAYQSTEFMWFYLIPFALILFKVWDYWRMITAFQIIVFLPFSPFPVSLIAGFVYLVLVLYALNLGSHKSIFLALISIYAIMLLSSFWQISTPYFPIRTEFYSTLESLERPSPVYLEKFPLALKISISNMLNFRKALSFREILDIMWENTVKMIFNDTYLPQAFVWILVLYLIAYIPGRLRGKYNEFKSSLTLLLIIPAYFLIYSYIREPFPLEIPFYAISSIALIYVIEQQGFRFSRELEIRKKKEEKYFGKFGLQELTLSKGERGLEDIGGYEDVKKELKESIMLPLQKPEISYVYGLKPPKGILLFGPPGTGKTMIMRALAKEIDYPFFYIKTSDILSHLYGETEKNLSEIFETARKHAPAILFFDEIDALAKKRGISQDDVTPRVLSTLLQELDGFKENKPIIFVASTNVPNVIDPALLRPGRIDKIIYMRLPTKKEREAIFKVKTRDLPIAEDVDFSKLAEITERFSGADIANVVAEVKRRVAERAKKEMKILPLTMKDFLDVIKKTKPSTSLSDLENYEKFKLDFERRYVKEEKEKPSLTFDDVVDMEKVKEVFKDSIELPLKHPELLKKYNLEPPSGLLLFGPPGTGKTYIVKAAAGEFEVPLYMLSGADLMKQGYFKAASIIKETFNKAKENAPSLIFIDEIETVIPIREGSSSITGQILQEMDGLKKLKNVLVIGATNLPHQLDPALLRPGRFDKILYIGLPNEEVRKNLFKLYLKDVENKNIDFDILAKKSKGYTPADINQICKNVKYLLVKKELAGEKAVLKTDDLLNIMKEIKPSISPKLLMVYKRFLEEYGERE